MKFAVIQFPGSCDDRDAAHAAGLVGEAELVWHAERDLHGADAVIVPGGFSYGDYLRAGAIARFSPAMDAVIEFAAGGGLVLGICNGFQVLCEAHLLPGALLVNANRRFTSRQVSLEVVRAGPPSPTGCRPGERAEDPRQALVGALLRRCRDARSGSSRDGQVLLRYAPGHNFNGSVADIAGVCNEAGNVFGLMPHPEHAVNELTGGSTDGLRIFQSMRLAKEGAVA